MVFLEAFFGLLKFQPNSRTLPCGLSLKLLAWDQNCLASGNPQGTLMNRRPLVSLLLKLQNTIYNLVLPSRSFPSLFMFSCVVYTYYVFSFWFWHSRLLHLRFPTQAWIPRRHQSCAHCREGSLTKKLAKKAGPSSPESWWWPGGVVTIPRYYSCIAIKGIINTCVYIYIYICVYAYWLMILVTIKRLVEQWVGNDNQHQMTEPQHFLLMLVSCQPIW